MRYTSWALADGCSDLATLGSDTSRAFAYADANVVEACAANGGLLYDHFLTGHRDAAQKCDELLAAVRSLYEHGSERLQRTMDAYALTEDENVSQVGSIWKVLESGGSSTPIGPAPSGTPTRGPLPSDGLAAPHSDVGGWIFDILSWPDYLVDAAADAIAVALCSGATVLEVLGAIVTFGASVVPASVSAVIAIVEALSAAWGWMMTAVYGVVGLGSMLGAATTTVTWVSIPEG